MSEVKLEQATRKTRELFDKASLALERGNTDYALDMLSTLLEAEPRLFVARKLLRAAQIKKFRDSGARRGGALSGLGTLGIQMSLSRNPLKAVAAAEKLLMKDPLNSAFLQLLAKAALAADLPEVALHALETQRETMPDDVPLLKQLGHLYLDQQLPSEGRAIFERLGQLRPTDPEVIKAIKDSQALETTLAGRWEEAKSFRDVIRDTDEAKKLEQEAKAVKTETDVDELIAEHLAKIEREPQNVNFRRALADLYTRAQRFDDAIAALEESNRMSGGGDPQVDRALSAIRVKKYEHRIAALRAAGKAAEADALETEKTEFIFRDAEDRVKRYPNDLAFKYDYGLLLFEREMFTDAIQQLQLAQRSPQRRIRALYYLARCFAQKNQYDIAAEQLEKAAAELNLMDETKKDVLYELGLVYEQMKQTDKAVDLFKQIYAADIGYRDVAQRIESTYRR